MVRVEKGCLRRKPSFTVLGVAHQVPSEAASAGKPTVCCKELWTGEEGQGWDINHGDSHCPSWWEVLWVPSPTQSITGIEYAET